MGKNERGKIVRDGFVYSHGMFRVDYVDRMEGSELRAMFLPNITPEGRELLAKRGEAFVRGQLQHYGVAFREDEFSGNGGLLMKNVLRAGKCDKVPDHILALREEMHTEWLDSLTPDELPSYPDFAMEKYFLTAGVPTKPRQQPRSTLPKNMREAVQKVEGLHCATGDGPKTQMIFMGWDEEAVRQAALSHAGKEAAESRVAEKQHEEKRDKLHQKYLESLERKGSLVTCSPVGHYIVDCEEIEQGWDNVKDLTLDINETDQDGIFRAVFDFSILVGVMLICTDKGKLNAHVSYLGAEYESDEGDTEESEPDEEEHVEENECEIDGMSGEADRGSGTRGRKRKSQASPRHEPRKKSRRDGAQEFQYFIKFRCRETGEGELYPEPEDGTLRYEDKRMAAFLGKVDMPCVGGQIPFAARKISNVPKPSRKSWVDYSDSEYEYVYV